MPYKDKERRQSEEYKEYQRNYQRSWHQRHRAERLARMYERKAAIHKYFQNMKNQLCCVDCGQRHPATLHFHHLNSGDKDFDIVMQPIVELVSIESKKKSRSASFCVPTAMLFDTTICEMKSKPTQGLWGISKNSTPYYRSA